MTFSQDGSIQKKYNFLSYFDKWQAFDKIISSLENNLI